MGYIKVTQDKFDLVKTLLNAGVKMTQIQEIVGLSGCTVSNIREAKDLDDYARIVHEQFEKKRQYDLAKAQQLANVQEIQASPKKGYTVTMVINVDEEHDSVVAPLTALVNGIFSSDNVAVEVNKDN